MSFLLHIFKCSRRGNFLTIFGTISPTVVLSLVECLSCDPNAMPPLGLIYIRLATGARLENDLSAPSWGVWLAPW